ncbi:Glycosyl hydrolase catalytic core [Planctomycetes bacterium K2D]|uniref:Glycosyl hydrolase catalytic core n=1 Tax=Botrimarina mediterranea TaxID=2528022 RepID=A0A518K7W6_9BACT|nr:Glycosyl hydrolase catalytic core [Botrimarina mediterranea]QDV78511.1 Glycosyl hydrolase catalytic core [Planctomycetes bacterium K2D]
MCFLKRTNARPTSATRYACAIALLALVTPAALGVDPLSNKRGFADVGASYNYLQATNAGWYYGWRPDQPPGAGGYDGEFVPMIFGAYQANQFEIDRILGYDDVEYVLGFNEPERPDQANITVDTAINAWRTLSNGFQGTDIKLISPGVADTGGADGGQAWLADFMGRVNAEGLKMDGVAFHWYGASTPNDPIGAANSFISRVDSYHNQYGLPVWITEFGIIDWGGNYTPEQMRAANATFLENVIPRLESRSYVERYAFYQWNSATTLIEGNPLNPTNVGAEYVGAIKPGETYQLAGADFGDRVAYLSGGELTHSGSAAATLDHVNALSGASRLTGAGDWGVSPGGWVRVQPGATLYKDGANRVVIDSSDTTNNGKIVVADGELVFRSGPRLTGSGSIQVNEGGVLRFDGEVRGGPGRFSHPIELNGGSIAAPSINTVSPFGAAVLSGEGVVEGGLTAAAGATIRVGGVGVAKPAWATIDNFESYSAGKLNAGATGGVWTGVFDGTANAEVVSAAGNESLQFYGTGSAWRGAQASLASSFDSGDYSLPDGGAGTYFFRVQRQGTQTIDGVFGLTDAAAIGTDAPWSELAITLSLFQGTGAGDATALRAFDGDGGGDVVIANGVAADEWLNVWLVVDNESKTYQVATSTGGDDGQLAPNTFSFGRQPALGASLDTFAGAEFRSGSNPGAASVRIDDLVFLAGENLLNPLAATAPPVIAEAAVLQVEGDYFGLAESALEIDLFDPVNSDKLIVSGVLNAGGELRVSLDPEAPAPQDGDAFDILDFASSAGQFAELDLPVLGGSLGWDTSQLYTNGVLGVVTLLPGDYNDDGVVDAADYTVWRDSFGEAPGSLPNDTDGGVIGQAQYATWAANYGSEREAAAAIPEPSGLVLLVAAAIGLTARRAA